MYIKRLEEGNTTDLTIIDYPDIQHSTTYGKFMNDEVRSCLKELKRNTAAGIDRIKTPGIRKLPVSHITTIMNYWWGWIIPKEAEECRTRLLPKKDDNLDQVGNWRPITVGNLFMRLYAKLWDKRMKSWMKRTRALCQLMDVLKTSKYYNRKLSSKRREEKKQSSIH